MKTTISNKDANQRVDKYLKKYLNDAPLSFIYKLIRKKDVKVNGVKVKENYILKENDNLEVYLKPDILKELSNPKEIKDSGKQFKVIFEDENILIVSKPMGLSVHGDELSREYNLSNQVLSYLIKKGEYHPNKDIGFTPALAHRIDRNTSGLVIFGKNLESLQILTKLFKDRSGIDKHYLTLVYGEIDKLIEINAPLTKDENSKEVRVDFKNGELAKSIVTPIYHNKEYSLVDVQIITGKTHQIRVHLSHIKHPSVGDAKYGDFNKNKSFNNEFNWKFQFLHAYKLKFSGIGGKLSYLNNKVITDKLPEDKAKIVKKIFNKTI
jgi:23S rRNA pseudouridine955/2504/2580 synthase